VYHYWISQTNLDRWSELPNLSNEMHDGTFVNGKRVIYNMQGRYVGSPYHQNYYRPDYDRCHFKWVFPTTTNSLAQPPSTRSTCPATGQEMTIAFNGSRSLTLSCAPSVFPGSTAVMSPFTLMEIATIR
jgi:hypothetical protein